MQNRHHLYDWYDRYWLKIHLFWFALILSAIFAVMYVAAGVVIGNYQMEMFDLREKLSLAEYDRDLYYATSRDQGIFIENSCKPLPALKMKLGSPIKGG